VTLVQLSAPTAEPIRVFPVRNNWTPDDNLAFVGDPPLYRPGTPDTPVMVSVTFTWHRKEAERIARGWRDFYRNVTVGGPAYGDAGGEFTPGRFLKKGCTITSRGCVKKCGWCVERTRPLREITIKPGWIVQVSNLLACSERHVRAVFDMLREQHRRIFFNGGLDKHFLRDWHRPLFDSIRIGELWFACDTAADLPALERATKILAGIPQRKLRCYTMIGYDSETVAEAERRVERVFELGFYPFCQLYQPDETKVYPLEWRQVRRKWSRPAAYKTGAAPEALPRVGRGRARTNFLNTVESGI
jgi:hypothetical protein